MSTINTPVEPLLPLDTPDEAPVAEERFLSDKPAFENVQDLLDADEPVPAPVAHPWPALPAAKTTFAERLKKVFARKEVPSPAQVGLPIRVILGYFPDISEKDAREYALGLSQKYCEQRGIVFVGAYKYNTGYVYEIQEGGPGLAYAPELIEHFESLGPLASGEYRVVVLRTASRLIEVQQLRDGLATVVLPEDLEREPAAWLTPKRAMTPAIERYDRFHRACRWVFLTGLGGAVLSGIGFRLQPIDWTAAAKPEIVSTSKLPRTQWSQLVSTPAGFYVRALRYHSGKWQGPELAAEEPPALSPTTPGASTPAPLSVAQGTPSASAAAAGGGVPPVTVKKEK